MKDCIERWAERGGPYQPAYDKLTKWMIGIGLIGVLGFGAAIVTAWQRLAQMPGLPR